MRADVLVGHLHALHLGQVLDGVHKAQAAEFHQEAQRVAMHPTAEAVIGLTRGADDEAGALFAVEGAQPFVVDARLLQGDVAAHDVGDIGAGEQVLNEGLGDHSGGKKKDEEARMQRPRRDRAAGPLRSACEQAEGKLTWRGLRGHAP